MRGLPGADLDRLPLAVPPVPGEHAASWLARVAYRYGLTPSGLLATLGLRPPSWSPRKVQAYLARHADIVERRLGHYVDLSSDRDRVPADAARLASDGDAGRSAADRDVVEAVSGRYLQAVLAGYQETYRGSSGGWRAGSRFCPSCLAASGGVWSTSWTSPLHLVCLTPPAAAHHGLPGVRWRAVVQPGVGRPPAARLDLHRALPRS